MPLVLSYAVLSVCLAWMSHIEADFVFGKAHTKDLANGKFVVMRGRGVPVPPFGYRGLGRKVNGALEQRVNRVFGRFMPLVIGASLGISLLRSI